MGIPRLHRPLARFFSQALKRPKPDRPNKRQEKEFNAAFASLKRKRRAARHLARRASALEKDDLAALTRSSFVLDGIDVTPAEVEAALSRSAPTRKFRSRSAQRLRNHAAVLRHIGSLLRRGQTVQILDVMRWYTAIGCGLSTTSPNEVSIDRLDEILHRINMPSPRLRPAIAEVARLHARLNLDPFVPSFNGILARLLLQYHLGRCGLPPVVFDAPSDAQVLTDENLLLDRIVALLQQSYDRSMRGAG